MPTICAFLGNQPRISLAELQALLPGLAVQKTFGGTIVLCECAEEPDQKTLQKLGGTIILGTQVQAKVNAKDVPRLLTEITQNVKGKVTFSIRPYGVNRDVVHDLYRDCKKALVKAGRSARYVGNDRKMAASALLHDAGLVSGKNGAELILLGTEDEETIWVGRTVGAQDPDGYTKRDMGKPVRDTTVGLLPPKLAQMLLNFGHWLVKEKDPKKGNRVGSLTVFDPFCGTGVIPIECLLRGWNVLASDASLKAVNGCTKNVEWARKEYDIKKKDVGSEVWKHDATKSFKEALGKNIPDMIVSETSLGPALSSRISIKDAQKLRTECDALETAFLKNVHESLPGVPVVCTFPVWYTSTGTIQLEKTWEKIHDLGFRAVLPPGCESDDAVRPCLIYRRPDQFVGRQIVMLRAS